MNIASIPKQFHIHEEQSVSELFPTLATSELLSESVTLPFLEISNKWNGMLSWASLI